MESSEQATRQRIAALLRQYWGFDSFRPVQERIILSVMQGRDTLALLPTGGGKSLTYQIPALAGEGLCIVVTPLVALMKDQVDRLRRQGIRALAIHSGLSARQIDIDLDNCVYGDVKFLYVAPERLASEAFRLRVRRMRVALLAVDEAHCISQWGYDFRPSYLRIAELRELLPGVPVLALTASAVPRVAEDIMEKLRFAEPHLLRGDFARPNLSYSVRRTDDKNEQLLRVIRNVGGSGIVYVRTREGAEQVASFLHEEGIPAEYYHGGLDHAARNLRQDNWISGRTPVMVATNAFGMGIDKADVRYVVHYTMCDSLESYYQEAGRAGRDGRRSYALLLVSPDDEGRVAKRFEADYPPLDRVRSVYEKICSFLQIALGDGAGSSHPFDLRAFCTREHLYAGTVRSALRILSQNGYMTLLEDSVNPARLLFCISRDDLYRLRVVRDDLDHIIRVLLRLYEGVFTDFRPIDTEEIARWSGYTPDKVHELLQRLWRLRVIRYIPANRSSLIYLDEERLPVADLYISAESYRLRRAQTRERFERMLAYAANEEECRSAFLARYFGEEQPADCGICDICLARKRNGRTASDADAERQLLRLLEAGALEPRQIAAAMPLAPEKTAALLDRLRDEGKISVGKEGKVAINR
ncbi:MAG: RecQ family ATP-dependent DNA helicase [Alistipes sp.]|nr:RecQ family ATP-dependent DNA helicase [Alistipes sp.]